jgi:hypothetical protein
MGRSLLHRIPSAERYDKKYQVHGHEHLTVEAYYADSEDGKPEFGYWWVRDNRFSALDRHRRETVFVATYLADIRSWLKAGGASLWDPEKRKADRSWKPIPDGWDSGDERLEAKRRIPFKPFGEKGSIASKAAPSDITPVEQSKRKPENPAPRDMTGKKYAVCPGYTRSSGGQRHYINFGALTWLYGVNPAECVEMDGEKEKGWNQEGREGLIWLYPQNEYEDYLSMREELERGEDAFKLVEP